jgi:hypothetical protein
MTEAVSRWIERVVQDNRTSKGPAPMSEERSNVQGSDAPGLRAAGEPAAQQSRRRWWQTLALFSLVVAVIVVRRPDQASAPAAWVEEGSVLFRQYLNRGWSSIFTPVNAYIVAPSKLVTILAYHTSFLHYPIASFFWTLIFSGAVATAILRAPTILRYRFAAALSVVLVPVIPEVLGTASYVFWLYSFLAVLSLLWTFDHRRPVWRAAFTLVGGLSSPLIIVLVPGFLLRLALSRRRSDLASSVIAVATAAIQLRFVISTNASDGAVARIYGAPISFAANVAEKFFGDYALNLDNTVSLVLGILMVGYMSCVSIRSLLRRDWGLFLLCYSIGATLVSVARVDIRDFDAFGNGPRYLFMTFGLLSWFWLYQFESAGVRRFLSAGVLLLALGNSLQHFTRQSEPLGWTRAASDCVFGQSFLSRRFLPPPVGPHLPVTITPTGQFEADALNKFVPKRDGTWGTSRDGADVGRLVIDLPPSEVGHRVAIELLGGPAVQHQRLVVLQSSGESISYELSAVAASLRGWTWFDLPQAVRIELIDEGQDWGEWVAISTTVVSTDDEPIAPTVYDLPTQFDGTAYLHWQVFLTQDECERFERIALF